MKRSSGILLHIFSLPNKYGIGTFGKSAYDFADFLVESKQKYWQVLPFGPTIEEGSPYNSVSSFAGNPYFIDLDYLIDENLITPKDIPRCMITGNRKKVNYKVLNKYRYNILRLAYKSDYKKKEYSRFKSENAYWLKDYSLYIALKRHFNMLPWYKWPDKKISNYDISSIEKYSELLKDEIEVNSFIQYLFYKQLDDLKIYLNKLDIKLIGDFPLYVSLDSCDVWANKEYFKLDINNLPTEISGVPPDYFSKTGQIWNTPIYNWEELRKSNYQWWIKRINHQLKFIDLLRIDHFRGLESYWSVSNGSKTAIRGNWNQGPGYELIDVINANCGKDKLLAENLGHLTKASQALLDYSGYLGMKVLQFESDLIKVNKNEVLYTGTHDNTTLSSYIKKEKINDSCYNLLLKGSKTKAILYIVPMQDYLELPSKYRMNKPNTIKGNWKWRLKGNELNKTLSNKISEIAVKGNRI